MTGKLTLTPKRLYYIQFAILVVVTLGAIGGALVGSQLLQKQSQQLHDLKLERDILDKQQQALNQAKQDLQRYAELEQIAKQVVPQEKNQVRTVREIAKFAQESGINIGRISFPGSELGEPTAPNVELTQLETVEGLNNVYVMEVALNSGGETSFDNLVNFLRKLESNRRTSQVSTISIAPSDEAGSLQFTITFNVYIKP